MSTGTAEAQGSQEAECRLAAESTDCKGQLDLRTSVR